MQTTEQTTLIHLTIDGHAISVPKGTTVFEAAKQLNIDVPIFCYHDHMPPFGACRVCLVEVEKMAKLQTSCTLEATEGMVVKTRSQYAEEGRRSILEFLLINHPLDCPICDRGGECPLQDQTLKYGPGISRFFEDKRRFEKPLPLNPVLMLDRERCIQCARCTRFGDLVAGDHALEFIDRGYRTEVGTPSGKPAKSKFIGNTIKICPVGALTSRVYRFRARPWDNNPTESSCSLCPIGCSLILDSRDGEIVRTRSLENREVNDIWLCDKGWFGYEFTTHPDRLKTPLIKVEGQFEPASWDDALSLIAGKLLAAKPGGKLAGLGGCPLTFEENYLFQRLMREGAGVNHVDYRVGMPLFSLEEEGLAPGMDLTIGECETLNYAVLFGLDLTEEFPLIWLRLKQAINHGAQVVFVGHFTPEISRYLSKVIIHAPGKELETLRLADSDIQKLVEQGGRGAFFVGRQYLASSNRKAILSKLSTYTSVSLNLLEGRGNSQGARLAGMRPDLGAFNTRLEKPGLNIAQILETAAQSGWDFLYVAGANLACKVPSALWKEARNKLGFLVVQDLFMTETAQQADVVLPTRSFVEKDGHFINIEGRVQTLRAGKETAEDLYSDASIFMRLSQNLGMESALDVRLDEWIRMKRLPVQDIQTQALPCKGHGEIRAQGGLSATFIHVLFDEGTRMNHSPHVRELIEEKFIRVNPLECVRRGIRNGASVRLTSQGRSFVAPLKWDEGVSEGTIVIPLGFTRIPAYEFGVDLKNGLIVDLQREE